MLNAARRLIGTLSVVCTAVAAGVLAPSMSVAQANSVSPSPLLNTCTPSRLSRPFVPWWDFSRYELVPGGGFENSTWTLSGGAKRVVGSEPYAVTGTLGSSSLSLPRGSSARSPRTCVGATYPSIRFFIAGNGSVAVKLKHGKSVIPVGIAVARDKWAPTPVMLTLSPVLAVLSGGTARVSVRFTSLSGRPRIDDVYIDPWARCC